jgi:hypothetical protein
MTATSLVDFRREKAITIDVEKRDIDQLPAPSQPLRKTGEVNKQD